MADNFVIPKKQFDAYKRLVKRANKQVKSNLQYLQEHNVQSEKARRALVKSFDDGVKWASKTKPFSSSAKGRYVWDADKNAMKFLKFQSKSEFEMYKRELERFGGKRENSRTFERSPATQLEKYRASLVDSLHSIADQYSIPIDVNQSKTLKNLVNNLTLDEIASFYDHYDIEDEAGKRMYESGDDYADATTEEEFIEITMSIVNVNKAMLSERKSKKRRKKKKRAKKTKRRKI